MMVFRFRSKTAEGTPKAQAARWLHRIESDGLTSTTAKELERWIAANPENEAAWQKIQATSAIISENAAHPGVMELRAEALAFGREPRDRLMFGIAAGAGLVIIVASASWFALQAGHRTNLIAAEPQLAATSTPDNARYQTAVGERSTLTLSDGSVVTLDTNSAVRVAYNEASRTIYLERGQAIFNVAKHKKIPFDVYASDRKITAVGTVFDVRLDYGKKSPSVRVALVEGKILVSKTSDAGAAPSGPKAISMTSGEVLTVSPVGALTIHATNTGALTSWRTGVLRFNDERLADVVDEMNRYTTQPIIIGQARLGDFRVSGAFKSGDSDYFAESIAEAFPVRIYHNSTGSPVLMPK